MIHAGYLRWNFNPSYFLALLFIIIIYLLIYCIIEVLYKGNSFKLSEKYTVLSFLVDPVTAFTNHPRFS